MGIIWAVISFFILHKQNKEIEKIKSNLDRKNYISKAQFDFEFEIYKNMSRMLGEMIKDNSNLYPCGLYQESSDYDEKIKMRKENYSQAIKSYNEFTLLLEEYEPFIDESISKFYDDIREKCRLQLCLFEDFRIREDKDMLKECRDDYRACWKRTLKIIEDRKALNIKMREYMINLNEAYKERA